MLSKVVMGLLCLLAAHVVCYSQAQDTAGNNPVNLPSKLLSRIQSRTADLD
jgi:hypothetical protein